MYLATFLVDWWHERRLIPLCLMMTQMITGPVAACVPPFSKIGPHLHHVVSPPAVGSLVLQTPWSPFLLLPSTMSIFSWARLVIVAGSASISPHLFITKVRLAIVAGPAHFLTFSISPLVLCHLPLALPLLNYPLFSLTSPCCHPARAGRHGRSKVILLTFANIDPQAIFWPSCTSRSTSGSGLSGCASPSGTISLWWTTLPGGASLRHPSWSLWFATTSWRSAFTWTRTFEWILRGL